MKSPKLFFFSLALTSLLVSTSHGVDDWSQFQNGGKVSNEETVTQLPTTWNESSGIRWKLDVSGYGQSSPVVAGDRIYLTSVEGEMKDKYHLMAIGLKTGDVLWKKEIKNPSPTKSSNYVSRAAPTPVCDADGVIAFFEGGAIAAYSPEGGLRWELNLVSKYGSLSARHGLASSLEQNDSHVFVWIEREKDPYVVALNKKDGKEVWKSKGLGVTTWSSPRLVPFQSGHHLVLSGIGKIAGYDPKSGKQLWSFDEIAGNSTPTPIPVGNGKFLIGASTGRGEQSSGKAARSNGLIQISESDGKFSAKFVWQAEDATSTFGSPLAHQGFAYFVNRVGVLYCLDLKTGKQVYASRTKSSIWATPIGIGDNVYLFGKDGTTTVVAAGNKFDKKATNPLWKSDPTPKEGPGSFGGHVLYAGVNGGDCLLLRRGDRLYCIGKKEN